MQSEAISNTKKRVISFIAAFIVTAFISLIGGAVSFLLFLLMISLNLPLAALAVGELGVGASIYLASFFGVRAGGRSGDDKGSKAGVYTFVIIEAIMALGSGALSSISGEGGHVFGIVRAIAYIVIMVIAVKISLGSRKNKEEKALAETELKK